MRSSLLALSNSSVPEIDVQTAPSRLLQARQWPNHVVIDIFCALTEAPAVRHSRVLRPDFDKANCIDSTHEEFDPANLLNHMNKTEATVEQAHVFRNTKLQAQHLET